MTREEVLQAASVIITHDRNQDYGEPENNFQTIADFWNIYLKTDKITAEDVGNMMVLFKMARIMAGGKDDSYIDIAGYIACACECHKDKTD